MYFSFLCCTGLRPRSKGMPFPLPLLASPNPLSILVAQSFLRLLRVSPRDSMSSFVVLLWQDGGAWLPLFHLHAAALLLSLFRSGCAQHRVGTQEVLVGLVIMSSSTVRLPMH